MSRNIKVELHVHTNYSYDCLSSFDEIIEKVEQSEIDAIAICDHNEIEGAVRLSKMAGFKVIIGQEVMTSDGEIIGLFLKKFVKPGMSMAKTISQIKQQGGIAYLPHPFDMTTRKTSVNQDSREKIIKDIDVIEVYNGRTIKTSDNKKAKLFAKKYKKLQAVGSDAHTTWEIGRNYLMMPEFSNPSGFLESLKKARHKTSLVIPWVFIATKLARFRKRNNLFYQKKKLESKLTCDICGSTKVELIYLKKGTPLKKYYISDDSYGTHPQIVKCRDCNLIFASPREDNKKILNRYASFVDVKYEEESKARSTNQQKILNRLNKIKPNKGKILEVGCATGFFLKLAQDNGWKATGVEPSAWACEVAMKRGIVARQGTLDTVKFKNKFDAIVCLDVIEHVSSPRKLLCQMKHLLNDDGVICIVTPDKSGMLSQLMGEKWWHIRPDHIYYFSRKTLGTLIRSEGMEVIAETTYGWTFSYDYWATRFKKLVPGLTEFLIGLKKYRVFSPVTKRSYSFNFHDSMELYLKKV